MGFTYGVVSAMGLILLSAMVAFGIGLSHPGLFELVPKLLSSLFVCVLVYTQEHKISSWFSSWRLRRAIRNVTKRYPYPSFVIEPDMNPSMGLNHATISIDEDGHAIIGCDDDWQLVITLSGSIDEHDPRVLCKGDLIANGHQRFMLRKNGMMTGLPDPSERDAILDTLMIVYSTFLRHNVEYDKASLEYFEPVPSVVGLSFNAKYHEWLVIREELVTITDKVIGRSEWVWEWLATVDSSIDSMRHEIDAMGTASSTGLNGSMASRLDQIEAFLNDRMRVASEMIDAIKDIRYNGNADIDKPMQDMRVALQMIRSVDNER
jgi:hypothetical protein